MKKNRTRGKKRITQKDLKRLFIAIMCFAVVYVLLSAAITPAKYDIKVGQPAPNTIKATKDVNDLITTEKNRSDAAALVKSIYYVDENAADETRLRLEGLFREFRSLSTLLAGDEDNELTDTQLEIANERLTDVDIDLDDLRTLAGAEDEELARLSEDTVTFATEIMADKLGENQLETALTAIEARLGENGHKPELVKVAMQGVSKCLHPNYFFDEQATEAARQQARDNVAVVKRIKGEVIVSDGELVSEAQYAMLKQLSLIKESTVDLWLYAGMVVLVIALMASVSVYLYLFAQSVWHNLRKILMLSLIAVITLACCVLARMLDTYLMPVSMALMMISVLIDGTTALYINLPMAIVASLLASSSGTQFNTAAYSMVISALVSGAMALTVLKHRQSRLNILLAGVITGASNMVCTFAVGLFASSSVPDSLNAAFFAGAAGLIAAALSIALIPLFEAVFNTITTTRLLELSNPNQPLLRRLLLEAPGTYHHSIIVANLAEAAADSVKANPLLARVGAYYHDIGKIKRPMYFKENQYGDNPHDRTDPRVSTAIITAHPKDGVQLLSENRIPAEIQEIVLSHHGNTPVVYFYNKSKEQNSEVSIDDYRYGGPRPRSREAAIIMLADTVEAAARTLPNPDPQRIKELINKLISQKLADGQLDECDLSFADIERISDSFVTVLSGAFHERIEYPEVKIPGRGPAEEK